MKISKRQLKRIIREETRRILNEEVQMQRIFSFSQVLGPTVRVVRLSGGKGYDNETYDIGLASGMIRNRHAKNREAVIGISREGRKIFADAIERAVATEKQVKVNKVVGSTISDDGYNNIGVVLIEVDFEGDELLFVFAGAGRSAGHELTSDGLFLPRLKLEDVDEFLNAIR